MESGELAGGDKLPGAREFTERIGVSLAIVQSAFTSLVREGILESVSRSGVATGSLPEEAAEPGIFDREAGIVMIRLPERKIRISGDFKELWDGTEKISMFLYRMG